MPNPSFLPNFKAIKAYHTKYGNSHPPSHYKKGKLSRWCNRVRLARRKMEKGEDFPLKLDDNKIALFDSINFPWNFDFHTLKATLAKGGDRDAPAQMKAESYLTHATGAIEATLQENPVDHPKNCIDSGIAAAHAGPNPNTIAKQLGNFRRYQKYLTMQCGISDPYLDSFTTPQKTLVMCGYAHFVRSNKEGKTNKTKLQGSTVATAISDMVQAFRQNLRPDPSTRDETGEKSAILKQ